MRPILTALALVVLAGCADMPMAAGGGGGLREQLVIGSSMSFDECRAAGGLIIQDEGSPMVACDPSVRRSAPPPVDDTATDMNAALEQQDIDEAAR